MDNAEGIALLERFDGFAGLRNGLRRIASERGDWAGIPMPLEGVRLIIEQKYPKAKELMEIGQKEPEPHEFDDAKIINTFWSWRWRTDITIWEHDGKRDWGKRPVPNHLGYDLSTLGASDVWGLEQEARAVLTLSTMLKHRQFKQYLLTGMFMESSPRSGVHYLFRKLKPTVAISSKSGALKILCALCQHPIAFYAESWAGAMCPTDDVLAMLMLMRGDERMLWARSNQHSPYRPEAGL